MFCTRRPLTSSHDNNSLPFAGWSPLTWHQIPTLQWVNGAIKSSLLDTTRTQEKRVLDYLFLSALSKDKRIMRNNQCLGRPGITSPKEELEGQRKNHPLLRPLAQNMLSSTNKRYHQSKHISHKDRGNIKSKFKQMKEKTICQNTKEWLHGAAKRTTGHAANKLQHTVPQAAAISVIQLNQLDRTASNQEPQLETEYGFYNSVF